jgi:hypothetical protein
MPTTINHQLETYSKTVSKEAIKTHLAIQAKTK